MRLEEQIALYNVFHRDRANRAIHGLTVPVIMVSGLMLLAPLGVVLPGLLGDWLPLNLGLAAVVALVGGLAPLDPLTALALGGWMFPSLLVANAVALRVPLPTLLAVNAAIQGVAWFVTVRVGHERFERSLSVAEGAGRPAVDLSSNLYFHRGYFLLRNVGRQVSGLQSFQQFAIGPFATTLDGLVALGYRPELRGAVDALVRANIARLARGEAILAEREPVLRDCERTSLDDASRALG